MIVILTTLIKAKNKTKPSKIKTKILFIKNREEINHLLRRKKSTIKESLSKTCITK